MAKANRETVFLELSLYNQRIQTRASRDTHVFSAHSFRRKLPNGLLLHKRHCPFWIHSFSHHLVDAYWVPRCPAECWNYCDKLYWCHPGTNRIDNLLGKAKFSKNQNQNNLLWDEERRKVEMLWEYNHEAWTSWGQTIQLSVVMEMFTCAVQYSNPLSHGVYRTLEMWPVQPRNWIFHFISF